MKKCHHRHPQNLVVFTYVLKTVGIDWRQFEKIVNINFIFETNIKHGNQCYQCYQISTYVSTYIYPFFRNQGFYH